MMRDILFGQWAIFAWVVACAIYTFLAVYMWLMVWEVGGIRSTAMGILFTGCAITCLGFAAILSHTALLSSAVAGAIISAAWPPMLLASIVLADLWAADMNSHRSFTTRSYLWYKRLTTGKDFDNGS